MEEEAHKSKLPFSPHHIRRYITPLGFSTGHGYLLQPVSGGFRWVFPHSEVPVFLFIFFIIRSKLEVQYT